MALEKITNVSGTAVYVPGNDIDTDRIIPARFMKCVTFDGLGEFAFYDERKFEDGSDKKHVMNNPDRQSASILISGENFGCGSSREHAPQALYRWGIRAVIAVSYAEIFFGNSTQLGIPCLGLSPEDIVKLGEAVEADPQRELTINVKEGSIVFGDLIFQGTLPAGARSSLIEGRWDPIGELLESMDKVQNVGTSLPYFV